MSNRDNNAAEADVDDYPPGTAEAGEDRWTRRHKLLAVTNLRRGLALLLTAALLWGISYVLSDGDLPGGALSNGLVLLIGLGGLSCGVAGVLRVIYGLRRWNAPAKADS